MPINYRVTGNLPRPSEFKPHSRTKIKMKCPTDPAARKRIPGCAPIKLKTATLNVPEPAPGPEPIPGPGPGPSPTPNPTPSPSPGPGPTPKPSPSPIPPAPPGPAPDKPKYQPVLAGRGIRYISDAQRKAHLDSIKKFREHPDVTDRDIFAGELAQAAYINDPDVMADYIDNVSTKMKGYTFDSDPNVSNKYVKTFVNPKTGDVAVAYRGTVDWVGQDGAANITNTVGLTKFRQMVADELNVDVRSDKAKLLKTTNENILKKYPGKVSLTAGHSQGGHDATQSKKTYFKEAESIVFMPAPGGEVKKGEGRMWTTPNDIVSLKGKTYSMFSQNFDMKHISSTVGDGPISSHLSDNFAPTVPKQGQSQQTDESGIQLQELTDRSELTNVSESQTVNERTPLVVTENTNPTSVIKPAVAEGVKTSAKGMATAMASSAIFHGIDPDATGQTELLGTAATNVALDSTAAGGMAFLSGAPVAATAATVAAEVTAPTVAAYEAGDAVYNAMDKATEDMKNRPAAGALTGGATGATAAVTATATGKVISAGVNTIKAARAGAALQETATAAEGGIELAEGAGVVAEGAELSSAAAATTGIEMGAMGVEGGLMTATEGLGAISAAQGGLDPFTDAAFAGAAVATVAATATGAFIGAINSSNNEKKRREQEKKDRENDKIISEAIHASHVNAVKAQINAERDEMNQFVKDTPEIGTDINTRLNYLYSHEKPYLNDPRYTEISDKYGLTFDPNYHGPISKVAPVGYQIQQEQIRYIHENLNIYRDYQKTNVTRKPKLPNNVNLYLDTKRLGAEPGYQNMDDDTFWLDKKRLGVTHFNETENKNDSTVPVETA